MRKNSRVFCLLCLVPFVLNFAFAEEEIVIESRFFMGIKQEMKPGPEVIISSFSEPFTIPMRLSNLESENQFISYLKKELDNIYQLKDVNYLATGNMIWDGKKKNLNGTIVLEEYIYPIILSPKMHSKNNVSLRIEIFKFKWTGISSAANKLTASRKDGEKLLDTELSLNFDEPVVLGFPSNGNPYFLSIQITKKKLESMRGEVLLAALADKSSIQIPSPILKVMPVYPEKCREEKVEGIVILEVTTDKGGNVIDAQILKDTHPELDRAAQEAIKQWKYEPVTKNGKPISAMFTVAVDFRLRKAIFDKNLESSSESTTDLETILRKSAEYCDKLAHSALFFVCQERIREEIYPYSSAERVHVTSTATSGFRSYRIMPTGSKKIVNSYVYDYQLIKKGDMIEESRTLLEENREERHEENAELKARRFYSERSAFGPVGLLSKEWQDMYSYKILKEKTIDGRKAIVIEAKPKRNMEGKPNYGKIWVDKEDFSIIRIEVEQESLAGYEELKKAIEKRKIRPIITVTHDYAIKKNGIRFPSKTTFKEDYFGLYAGRLKKSRMHITYDNYRFFTVEVKVKY